MRRNLGDPFEPLETCASHDGAMTNISVASLSARLKHDQRGSVLVLVALLFPILIGLSTVAIDYASLVKRRAELQRAADSGSIAGVNQFKLANADDAAAIRTAEAMARAQAQNKSSSATIIKAKVLANHTSVSISVSEQVQLSFGKLLNMPTAEVSVTSTAKLSGTTRLCLLALDPSTRGAFHLEKAARITASDCSIYSNSNSPAGIEAENAALATALTTCSVGGYSGSSSNFTPPPATGCPALRDPLVDRAGPPIGSCVNLSDYTNPKKGEGDPDNPRYGANVVSGAVALDPGTYCGGLHLTKKAQVTLRPGIYIMKDGPLVVDKKASMTGANVGFYFVGNSPGLLFDQDSVISLTAPKEGPMSGLLLFEDRKVASDLSLPSPLSGKAAVPLLSAVFNILLPGQKTPTLREYRIISDDARNLLGTIYLPVGRLIIDSKRTIADQSAYTVIVARLINLYDGPNLMLNARYGSTDVPVPAGVGPSSADTQLTQ
jgi:Flp pilus assembly protein TadG